MTLEKLINTHAEYLNDTDLYIWKYIAAHKRECSRMSIEEMAQVCNVSKSTIIRFAKKIALTGFSHLKIKLQDETSQNQSQQENLSVKRRLSCYIDEDITEVDFDKINKMIHDARRIFIYASGHVQQNAVNEIIRLFTYADVHMFEIKGYDECDIIMKNIQKGDLFIIVSLSGETKRVVDIAQRLHMYKIPLISIARLKNTPLAQLSNENIYISPLVLPTGLSTEYTSMAGFFVMAELWFISYTKYCTGL